MRMSCASIRPCSYSWDWQRLRNERARELLRSWARRGFLPSNAELMIRLVRDAVREMARHDMNVSGWIVTSLADHMNISPTHAEWLRRMLSLRREWTTERV